MPRWAIAALKWGGLAVAVINVIAIVWGLGIGAQPSMEITPTQDPEVPYTVYMVLGVIGALAAFLGFVMDRGRYRHDRPR